MFRESRISLASRQSRDIWKRSISILILSSMLFSLTPSIALAETFIPPNPQTITTIPLPDDPPVTDDNPDQPQDPSNTSLYQSQDTSTPTDQSLSSNESTPSSDSSPIDITASKPKRISEVLTKRSEFATTYLLDNGQFEAVISQTSVNYQDRDGTWEKIDTNLTLDAVTNTFKTKSTRNDIFFLAELPCLR